jgi:hypothetical protein
LQRQERALFVLELRSSLTTSITARSRHAGRLNRGFRAIAAARTLSHQPRLLKKQRGHLLQKTAVAESEVIYIENEIRDSVRDGDGDDRSRRQLLRRSTDVEKEEAALELLVLRRKQRREKVLIALWTLLLVLLTAITTIAPELLRQGALKYAPVATVTR